MSRHTSQDGISITNHAVSELSALLTSLTLALCRLGLLAPQLWAPVHRCSVFRGSGAQIRRVESIARTGICLPFTLQRGSGSREAPCLEGLLSEAHDPCSSALAAHSWNLPSSQVGLSSVCYAQVLLFKTLCFHLKTHF